MWISQNEGAKFWLNVLIDLKNRGLDEILLACVDGLTGFPEAIDRKILAADLKEIYSTKTLTEAELALEAFSAKWDAEYPSISAS